MISVERSGDGLSRLLQAVEVLGKKSAKVGVPSDTNAPVESINLATLAMILERGTADGHIPARPFLTQTLAENAEKYTALFAKQFESGASAEQALNVVALVACADVQQNIVDGDWVANAAATIKRKGSSKPLIDKGTLRQSIRGVVTDD